MYAHKTTQTQTTKHEHKTHTRIHTHTRTHTQTDCNRTILFSILLTSYDVFWFCFVNLWTSFFKIDLISLQKMAIYIVTNWAWFLFCFGFDYFTDTQPLSLSFFLFVALFLSLFLFHSIQYLFIYCDTFSKKMCLFLQKFNGTKIRYK